MITMIVSRHVHITLLLRSLHWLRMPERITFRLRLEVLMYRCLHGFQCIPVPGIQTRLQNGVERISHYIFLNG